MEENGKKVENRNLWKKFLHLIRVADIPWIGLLVYMGINFFTVYAAVRLPQVESDIYTGNASVQNIIWVIAVDLASSVLVSVMLAAYGVIGGRIDRNFRDAVWKKLLALEPKYFEEVPANTMLSRITDDAESMKDFLLLIIGEITGIAATGATIMAMSTMNKGLAVIMAVFIPVIVFCGFLFGRMKMKTGNSMKYEMSQLTNYLSSQLTRAAVIKAYNGEEIETKRGEGVIDTYCKAEVNLQIADFIRGTVQSLISIVPHVLLILAGIHMLEKKTLTPAGWIVFYSYALNLMSFFISKADTWVSVKEYQGKLNRLSDLLSTPDEGIQQYLYEDVAAGDIALKDVSFSFGEKKVLDHASMNFQKGELTVLLGKSGSGKTTVLKLLERIYDPEEGVIALNGKDLKDYKLSSLRDMISYVEQDTPLISGTLRENILYGVDRNVSDEEILSAAEEIHASNLFEEEGLDRNAGQFGSKLSGGQKQKLSLLRAFLQEREYVLLDEPTASLDLLSTNEVMEAVNALKGKRTVIMACHESGALQYADHIVVMEEDGSIQEGTFDEMEEKSTFFRKMIESGAAEYEQ